MQRVLDWIKRQGDHNVVSYSRFGLPGEELDDRPPPTTIHVQAFDPLAKHFTIMGVHSQRASIVSAGVGMSVTIFIFLSIFFEFDWYNHRKGVDFGALIGLILFLVLGMMTHWYVIAGIKQTQSRHLVPFIIVYAFLLSFEFLTFIVLINNWLAPPYTYFHSRYNEPGAMVLLCSTFLIIMACQGLMLLSVIKCRNFLECKSIHELEKQVAQKSKQQYPAIRVVFGPVDPTPTVSVAENNNSLGSAPPNYETATANDQRTIFQAMDA